MSSERRPELGFGNEHAVALEAPVRSTKLHQAHALDHFIIELDQHYDTATIYLSEVDRASGAIPITRTSGPIPLGMLADLVRRRPMNATEKEEDARAEHEAEEEFGDGEDEEEGQSD